MTKLRVKLLAYPGADEEIYNSGKRKFSQIIAPQNAEFVEEYPDILFFLTGGSERPAVNAVKDDRFYVLIAFQEGNSYAAATEVKAYLNAEGMRSVLLDFDESETKKFIHKFHLVKEGLNKLHGQRLGLIGEVSEWLVASDIEAGLLQRKLGIRLQTIPWKSLLPFASIEVSDDLMQTFPTDNSSLLEDTSKVYNLLNTCIQEKQFDAITVECFSLVREHAVTACLPLAKFNADGIPAGCEGDIVSIVGMMVAKAVTGIVPWMANTVKVAEGKSLFAHCTVAPNLLSDYTINTHFETGVGTAVQGNFKGDEIILFRFNNRLSKAFITTGHILNRPNYDTACRTQIEVKLPTDSVKLLRENPLGNHHLIIPGDHRETITLVSNVLGMEVLQAL